MVLLKVLEVALAEEVRNDEDTVTGGSDIAVVLSETA